MKSGTPKDEIDKLFATAVDLHRRGHLQQAQTLYRAILAVDARHADALHLLGVASHQQGEHASAAEMIGRAIDLNRRAPQYHFNLGVALQALQDHTAAAQSYRRAVQLQPEYAAAWENLGVALQDADDFDSARAAYVKALSLDARAVLAHLNLGTLLLNLGRVREAQEHFRAILALHPAHAEAHAKYAGTLLATGQLTEGWQEYEWRHHSRSVTEHHRPRLVPYAKWDGSSLADKTLLIHPEQGIGEELMFASCYAQAIAHARHCVIESDPRLVALFARSFPSATVIAGERVHDFRWNDLLPDIDYRIPAGSLPRFLRQRPEDFPDHDGYLRVDAQRRAHWRQTLATLGKPLNIGISWSGGRDPRATRSRSIPLVEWQPLLGALDASFVNLQYGRREQEIDDFHRAGPARLHTLAGLDPIKDPDDAMALISALDLVISIDNATVFMAGSVGTPMCVLLPANGEWRWRGTSDRSDWYPRALLFRQHSPGLEAWREVLRRVATELPARLAQLTPRAEAATHFDATPQTQSQTRTHSTARTGSALLVNDTRSWYHWGCSCTSLAIHAQLRRRWSRIDSLPIQRLVNLMERPGSLADFDDGACFERFCAANEDVIAQLRAADTIYINGEGTLHGVSPQTIGLLYVAYIARRRFDRPVHLINHSCYPDDTAVAKETPPYDLYRAVYRELDFVAVREPISAQVVRDLGISVTESFDCLPLFIRDQAPVKSSRLHDDKTVVIAGSAAWGATATTNAIGELIVKLHSTGLRPLVLIGADAHLAADDVHFASNLQRIAAGYFQLVNATSEVQWLRTIADAALLVSGRFHHSIAAAFLDTPFILMESNTPKIAGLMQRLESQSFVSIAQPNLGEVLYAHARRILAEPHSALVGPELRERLLALAERNFAQTN
jgi:polysaccharide pyruvyl transferase WcaK-like protein/Flp pilus assembly protein TadD